MDGVETEAGWETVYVISAKQLIRFPYDSRVCLPCLFLHGKTDDIRVARYPLLLFPLYHLMEIDPYHCLRMLC